LKIVRRLLLPVLALCAATPAFAQLNVADGRLIYAAAFFEAFAPANALQMIERLPGFTVENAESGVRGFGQAAGNVVINGQRPSSKSDSLAVILARIPSSRVLRVEIAPGNSFGADYASRSQVANVVLTDATGLAGIFDAKLAREFTGSVLPTASASAVYRHGHSNFSASLALQNVAYSEEGFDRLADYPTDGLLERREVFSHSREPYRIASVGWAHEPGEDRSAHINAKVSIDPWDIDQTSHSSASSGEVRDDVFTQRHVWKTYELSGDVTRRLLGGLIKLNALATRRDRRHDDTSVRLADAGLLEGIAYELDDMRDERVLRLGWTRATSSGWSIEFGGEGAYNRLSSETGLFTIDAQNLRTRVDLPIETAIVSEHRGEVFTNLVRNVSSRIRLDFGVAYEASRLEVRGDSNARRSLGFLRPRASIDWQTGHWQVQLGIKRTVAQLDFADFVSVAEVNEDRISGGNAELVPERAWELLLSASRKVLEDGRLKIDLGHDRISLVQDRVPTAAGFDAPGNLGNGSRSLARVNLDLALRRLGIPGGRLSLAGTYTDTSVRDPYALRRRPFSGGIFDAVKRFEYAAGLRQDFVTFAWGIDVKGDTGTTGFWRTETDEDRGVSPNLSTFVEFRPSRQLTATFGVENALDRPANRWRNLYSPDRTNPVPDRVEYRERNSHRIWFLSVKQNFGRQ
jgi:hypothetical protein